MSVTFIDAANPALACASPLEVPAQLAEDACPVGTAQRVHSQNASTPHVPLFKTVACEPCKAGFSCAGGRANATECAAGSWNPLVGAATCVAACGNGTASGEHADRCQECAAGTTPNADHTGCVQW